MIKVQVTHLEGLVGMLVPPAAGPLVAALFVVPPSSCTTVLTHRRRSPILQVSCQRGRCGRLVGGVGLVVVVQAYELSMCGHAHSKLIPLISVDSSPFKRT
jgi:hypothetical protein